VVTVRRKIVRRIIVLPDGSRKEIEEEVPSEETDSDFDVVEREEESSTEEVIAEPDVIEEQESTPDVPEFFGETPREPKDEVVFRREVHRTVVVPADKDKTVDVIPSESEEEPSLDEVTQVRKVVTVRRKIVRRIIVLPDGTRKEVEEEVPAEEVDSDYDVIEREQVTSTVVPVDLDTSVAHPKPVERVHVTRVVRKPDGEEDIIDQSDSVFPLEPEDEPKEAVEEQEKDRHGMVIRRIVRRPVTVTSKRSVIRRIELLPDGGEKELEKSVEESAKEDEEPSKVRRVVHRYKTGPTGDKVPDEPEHVSPLECSTTEESDSEVDVKRVKGKEVRTISRRSISTSQKKIIRRVVESTEGESDAPVEDTIEEPVETSKYRIVRKTIIGSDGKTDVVEEPHFELPEDAKVSVGEEKDDKGVVVRRIIRRPVPVITRRRVYRKVVLAPDGTEKGVEEKVLEPSEVDEHVPVHEDVHDHPTAVVIEEQKTTPPHLIEEIHREEPRDEVIVKREVHRTVVVPVEQGKTVDVMPPLKVKRKT
jgi:hypothetical protein